GPNITPIACLWMGTAINQVTGDRISHIFLVYVHPEHRRRGIGAALMNYGEQWTKTRGDRQISLQVFTNNKPALSLYEKLGYQPQSLGLVKQI
ncbi:GNAT family N-acetyltransferase, partial [Arthrospira platensis SPKY2]